MKIRNVLPALLVLLFVVSGTTWQRSASTMTPNPAALPDLVIPQYKVVDAKKGQIKLLIKNQGTADAPAGLVDIWLPIKPGSDEHYPRDEPAIAKGQQVWVEITIGYNVSGRKFYAWADSKQKINESSEFNNRIMGTF